MREARGEGDEGDGVWWWWWCVGGGGGWEGDYLRA